MSHVAIATLAALPACGLKTPEEMRLTRREMIKRVVASGVVASLADVFIADQALRPR